MRLEQVPLFIGQVMTIMHIDILSSDTHPQAIAGHALARGRLLEIHHVFARRGLDVNSRRLHQAVSDFAIDSRLQEIPTLDERSAPTLADARAELRDRAVDTTRTARALGTAAAAGGSDALRRGGRRISKSALGRVRRTMKDEEA